MRFRRWHRPEPYNDTSRKRAAFLRKQRLEREALPLFADQIAAGQRGVDEEMARRAVWWDEAERERRRMWAETWRKARARLFALPDALRRTVREIWRDCPYPADPACFADLLHQIDVGRVDPHRPPWKFHAALKARTTPDPSSFDAAFRQIGQRKVGGGPKTTEADELLFCGNLGSGILFLRSRVRLVERHESFYTSSNHRLRDSKVGSGGHYFEIEVTGGCSDADLATIERIAQAADTRPVVVRRAARPGRTTSGRAA
ncbi:MULTISPECIES: hypothetical protein [Hyphomicrobiales]|uniref:Uncharacterized protein n=1 Tax=Rhizobium subbaraonis TaxID=908946 RepID=A0A285V186_9HYPH|nr:MULTISPECIES: hypothetical protein [Hyphomicrobiales]SOC46766.1 hypothetical protein SAMN05892877_12430 [Rhizobium subbaraonis]